MRDERDLSEIDEDLRDRLMDEEMGIRRTTGPEREAILEEWRQRDANFDEFMSIDKKDQPAYLRDLEKQAFRREMRAWVAAGALVAVVVLAIWKLI